MRSSTKREKRRAGHARLMRQAGLCRLRVPQPAGKQNRPPCQPEGKGEQRHQSSHGALLPRDCSAPRASHSQGTARLPYLLPALQLCVVVGFAAGSCSCVTSFKEVVVRKRSQPFSWVNQRGSAGSLTQPHFHSLSDSSVLLQHPLGQG